MGSEVTRARQALNALAPSAPLAMKVAATERLREAERQTGVCPAHGERAVIETGDGPAGPWVMLDCGYGGPA